MDFKRLREANSARYLENKGNCHNWLITEWTNALAGEVGELCNIVKKTRRGWDGDPNIEDLKQDIGYELADIIIYADIIVSKLGIDLGEAIREKFNIVSNKRGSLVFLDEESIKNIDCPFAPEEDFLDE